MGAPRGPSLRAEWKGIQRNGTHFGRRYERLSMKHGGRYAYFRENISFLPPLYLPYYKLSFISATIVCCSERLLRAGPTVLPQSRLLSYGLVDAGSYGSSTGGAERHHHLEARHSRIPGVLDIHARYSKNGYIGRRAPCVLKDAVTSLKKQLARSLCYQCAVRYVIPSLSSIR